MGIEYEIYLAYFIRFIYLTLELSVVPIIAPTLTTLRRLKTCNRTLLAPTPKKYFGVPKSVYAPSQLTFTNFQKATVPEKFHSRSSRH